MNFYEILFKVQNAQDKFLNPSIRPNEILKEIQDVSVRDFDLYENAYAVETTDALDKQKFMNQFNVLREDKANSFMNEFGKITNLNVPYGVIGMFGKCSIYNLLRIISTSIITRNALIINLNENVGITYLIVNSIKNILTRYGAEDLISLYSAESEDEIVENFEKLDAIIYIGKKANCERFKLSFTKPVIYSGCSFYEVYVEDRLDAEFLVELSDKANVKIYSKEEVGIGQIVSNVEEAISKINEEGNGYGSSIITSNVENAKIFVDKVKTRNVFVNASPTLLNDEFELEPGDLMFKKSVLFYE